VPVILGSDAHITFDIANYDNILPLLNETEFPEELIINDKPNAFIKLLEKKGNELLSSKN
jgi:putative hydrolase